MNSLPKKLFRGVASLSPHHLEAQNTGMCTPQGNNGGHGLALRHTAGDTHSIFTSWTASRMVAAQFCKSNPTGMGVVLEIDFAEGVAKRNTYIYAGEVYGEDEYLIEGKIYGVKVRPM